MRKFEDLFNLKLIKILTLVMSFAGSLFVIIVNIVQFSRTGELKTARILYLSPWALFEGEAILSYIYYIATILAVISAGILVKMNRLIKAIEEKNVDKSELREKLRATTTYLAIGKVFEAFYLLFLSDFRAAWEVVAQLYILFDSLAIILFIAISFSIFLVNDILHNENMARITFLICMIAYFFSFVIMILYGISPEGFAIGIYLVIAITFLLAIIGVLIVSKIIHIYGRISTNRRPLVFIAVQILLLIISIGLLIGCGLTISLPNLFINRFLRVLRMIVFIAVSLMYYPAFIAPAHIDET